MPLTAEVISIGDELTSGQRLDTNSQWLSERLAEIGIQVLYHTTVADDLAANIRVFREAVDRVEVVVASGGLGPTADDLTREVLAALIDAPLVRDDSIVEHIRGMFARFGRTMPERNVVQAMFPTGSRVIPNPTGTAPGIALEIARTDRRPCRVFALPGVPAEMFRMWQETVVGELSALGGKARVIKHRRIKCFGISESEVEQRMPDLIRRGRTPSVGITVSAATITLRITASGSSTAECDAAMVATADSIYEGLGNIVYGEEDEELEDVIVRLLQQRGMSLATVEWGTGGLVAHRLHDATHDAGNYLGGLVVPSATSLSTLLNVPADLIVRHSPVSSEVVEAMAIQLRERIGADMALAVSQFPDLNGADSGPAGNEPKRLFLALATPAGVSVRSVPHFGDPSILTTRAAKQALNFVRLALLPT